MNERIRRRRHELDLTLEQLAERSGLTPNYLGRIEHGKAEPSLSTLIGIAKGLGMQVGELVGGPLPELSETAQEVSELFDEAAEDVQKGLLLILRGAQIIRRRAQR